MRFAKLERRPELDALRGLFLLVMITAHLPTHLSHFVDDPLGYISSAEGFVGLSAVLLGRIYYGEFFRDAVRARTKIWRRTLRIYSYHMATIGLAFTVAASYAEAMHRPAILNLLHFYFLHPVAAITGSLLLLYCPPLLDVLPLFIVFMLATPLVLSAARRVGWGWVLAASGGIWAGAQLGLRSLVYGWLLTLIHLRIPLRQTGSFNLLAWQAVWVLGLWLGARSAEGELPLDRVPRWGLVTAAALCAFFLAVRHGWLGPHLDADSFGIELDKWRMAPVRAVNVAAFVVVAWRLRRYFVHLLTHEPLLTMGKVSLQVFCAHLFFVFAGLSFLVGDRRHLHGTTALVLIAITYPALTVIAYAVQRSRQREAAAAAALREQSNAEVRSKTSADAAMVPARSGGEEDAGMVSEPSFRRLEVRSAQDRS